MVQATIRVVNSPDNIVGNGPFVPSNSYGSSLTPETSRNNPFKIDKVHPNQLSRDFKPSLRLPDNFVHQIGNMIIDPNSGEVFKSSASNEQKIPAMKKMIFPHSSEENDFSIEDMMNAFRPMNPTNPTRPTNKPLKPSKEVLADQLKPVETSKPVEVTEISGEEEEYYDEYASEAYYDYDNYVEDGGEYDYDYYDDEDLGFRTVSEDAIQALLLSNNKDIAAIDEGLSSDGITPTAIGQMSQRELLRARRKIIKDILKDGEKQGSVNTSNNPNLTKIKKGRRRIRPYSQVQRRPRHFYKSFGRKLKSNNSEKLPSYG